MPLQRQKNAKSKKQVEERNPGSVGLPWYECLDENVQAFVQQNTHPDFNEAVFPENRSHLKYYYPTPLSEDQTIRQYQVDCVEIALKYNTLVSLPTGLGKTFIAAVVLYNYQKYYPDTQKSRFVFLAPTKALVDQQVVACAKLMDKPTEYIRCVHSAKTRQTNAVMEHEQADTAGMARLKSYINDKRPFIFMTPQTLENDLNLDIEGEFSRMIRLIVIDEAHRATGGYAYVNVVRQIYVHNRCLRIVALSATPGNSEEKCQEILHNCLIERVKYYHEGHEHVAAYTFKKDVKAFYVNLPAEIAALAGELSGFLDSTFNCQQFKALYKVSLEESNSERIRSAINHANAEGRDWVNFQLPGWCMFFVALLYDYLRKFGIVTCYTFIKEIMDVDVSNPPKNMGKMKVAMARRCQKDMFWKLWVEKLKRLRDGIKSPENMALPTGSPGKRYSHPKFRTIFQQINALFCRKDRTDAQVIIFCPLRSIAIDLFQALQAVKTPDGVEMKPALVLGQRSKNVEPTSVQDGSERIHLTVKEQQKELEKFRKGELNVACATSVAEEGLDIGKIDMVIMYDIFKNTTRFTQRLGRCGRKRAGKCILLGTNDTDEVDRVAKQKEDFEAKFVDGYKSNYYTWLKHNKVKPVLSKYSTSLHNSNPTLKREFIDYTEDADVDLTACYKLEKKRKQRAPPNPEDSNLAPRKPGDRQKYEYLKDRLDERRETSSTQKASKQLPSLACLNRFPVKNNDRISTLLKCHQALARLGRTENDEPILERLRSQAVDDADFWQGLSQI